MLQHNAKQNPLPSGMWSIKRIILGSILLGLWTLTAIIKVRSLIYEQYSSGILLFLGYALVIFALLIWMIVAGSRANNKARG